MYWVIGPMIPRETQKDVSRAQPSVPAPEFRYRREEAGGRLTVQDRGNVS